LVPQVLLAPLAVQDYKAAQAPQVPQDRPEFPVPQDHLEQQAHKAVLALERVEQQDQLVPLVQLALLAPLAQTEVLVQLDLEQQDRQD
jgi:hypothetical protein